MSGVLVSKARPYLHPTLGHLGQNAPKKVLRALSGPEGDVNETVRRFARATRHQPVEHAGVIHPLSGRLMGMARGGEFTAGPPVTGGTKTQRKLVQLAQRHAEKRPELAQRAMNAAQRKSGPRPILIHNHPKMGSHTRHMPSSVDLGGTLQHSGYQAKVITHEPHQRRGAPKSRVTTFGHYTHPRAGTTTSHEGLADLQGHDLATTPPHLVQSVKRSKQTLIHPLQRRAMGMTRAQADAASHEGRPENVAAMMQARRSARWGPSNSGRGASSARGSDFDTYVRQQTQRRGKLKRSGGFYTREQMMKRDSSRVHGRTNRGAANVGKRLVDEDTHTSIPRLIGMGAGMGAIAWGGSRSKVLRRSLRSGGASPELNPQVRRALNLAEHARQSIEVSTSPLGRVTGRGIGRMPAPLRAALQEVPRPLRPATATLAGAILVQHARPVRQSTYSPVVDYGSY